MKEYEAVKQKIKSENAVGVSAIQKIDSKFNGNSLTDSLEQEFRLKTIGLVSADDFRLTLCISDKQSISTSLFDDRKARAIVEEKSDSLKESSKLETERLHQQQQLQQKKDDREKKRKKLASALSFEQDFDVMAPSSSGECVSCATLLF